MMTSYPSDLRTSLKAARTSSSSSASKIITSFAVLSATSLFSFSIPDRNLDCITTFNHRWLEGLDHQATVPRLVKVDRLIVINQQVFTKELIFFQDEVRHDSPFARVKQSYIFYIRFAFFHKPSVFNSPPFIVHDPHVSLPAQNDNRITRPVQFCFSVLEPL